MANSISGVFCVLATVFVAFELANGQPITKEDADSLLPSLPKTENETVAAIVQDAVVQQAVQSVVGDGSLSGLVVKKNTVILPVNAPDVVLSHQEEILTAPLSDLENIRKNITQTVATLIENENSDVAEVDEITLAEIIPLKGEDLGGAEVTPSFVPSPEIKLPEKISYADNNPEKLFAQSLILSEIIGDKIRENETKYHSNRNSETISSSEADNSASSLSRESSEGSSSEEANSSEENDSGDAVKEILEFGARIPEQLIAAKGSDLRPAVKIETGSNADIKIGAEGDVDGRKKQISAMFSEADDGPYRREYDNDDMATAEDIIFRPLFRYRQQQNERTRILENRSYQKLGYRRYDKRRPVHSYSSSASASDSYSNYNYNYRRPHKTRYYDDY